MSSLPAEWQEGHPVQDMSVTPGEIEDLTRGILHAPWADAARLPMVAGEALRVLGELALEGSRDATQCLRRLHRAVDLGGPLDEPLGFP